jgi:site-specific DNA-methyltransferase (adenine-specific)
LIQLLHGNCLDLIKTIPDKSIDLVCVDPPYMIDYKEWDNHLFQESKDNSDFMDTWIKECFRVLKDTGSLWSFMGYQNLFSFFKILENYGTVHYENWVIWARTKGRGASKHLKSLREDIIHVTKDKLTFTWNNIKMLRKNVFPYMKDGAPRGWFVDEEGNRCRWTGLGNIWVYTAPFWNFKDDIQVHPSQKPLMLLERLINLSSNEGDTILDPFMGSGSTGVAVLRAKRNFIGMEQNDKFFQIAQERIKQEQEKDLTIFDIKESS